MAGLGSQIAEHGLRVLVAAFNQRAGEAYERRLRKRIAPVLGEAVNEIVLAAMRFVGNDDVSPVRQQRILIAFFIRQESLNCGKHHAAGGDNEYLAQNVPVAPNGSKLINLRHDVGVRAEKTFSIKMNQMLRVFCNPHFRLPRNLGQETPHNVTR